VAISAFGEAGQHAGRVWCAVTALAGRHGLVFIFMAGNAGYALVFCIACSKKVECFFVTGCAHLVGGVGGIGDSCRHMCLVTTLAVCNSHIRAMRFMALGAERNFAMYVVAESTSEVGMFALNLLQFDDLLGVAGEALFCHVVGQLDDLGGMRIVVATVTACQLVVRFAVMALTAQRNDFLDGWRMAGVAILTGYACFVGGAICHDIRGCGRMAFDTVSVAEGRFLCRRLSAKSNSGKHYRQNRR